MLGSGIPRLANREIAPVLPEFPNTRVDKSCQARASASSSATARLRFISLSVSEATCRANRRSSCSSTKDHIATAAEANATTTAKRSTANQIGFFGAGFELRLRSTRLMFESFFTISPTKLELLTSVLILFCTGTQI